MAMHGRMDWQAANDSPKADAARREWIRPPGESWYRPATPAAAPGEAGPASHATAEHLLVAASRVAGASVYTTDGRRMGRIAEIALDEATGDVAFVVVVGGGFLGIGEHVARVPWSALTYVRGRGGYVVALPDADLGDRTGARNGVSFEEPADRGGWVPGA